MCGEGNGNALQYSCLENPTDRGAWWAAIYGVAKTRTRLMWLHFNFSLSCIGEGNGNPLHCSCLENPRDRGAWWAAIYGVAQSWTRLMWLSSSSSKCVSQGSNSRQFDSRGLFSSLSHTAVELWRLLGKCICEDVSLRKICGYSLVCRDFTYHS